MIRKIGLVVASFAAVAVIFAGARTFAGGDACKSGGKTSSLTTTNGATCCLSTASNAKMASGNCCAMAKPTSETGSRGPFSLNRKGAKFASGTCSSNSASAQTAAGSCASKGAKAGMTSGGCSSKGSSAAMTSGSCMSQSTNSSMPHAGCGMTASKASYAANVYEARDGHQYAVCNGQKFEVTPTTPYMEVGNARYFFADEESRVRCAEKMKSMAADLDREAVSLATAEGNVTTDSYGRKYAVCPITNEKFLVTADSPAKVMDGQKYYVRSDKCLSQLQRTTESPQSH
jgi:hypothetical protein